MSERWLAVCVNNMDVQVKQSSAGLPSSDYLRLLSAWWYLLDAMEAQTGEQDER
jgi:hypothetical protein